MGKLSCESKFELENSLLVHSLFTNREKISDLWELDSLGIKDPSEKKSKLELQDLALKHFENTVLRDDECRYIAETSSMQPCSSISNGGAGLEPRAETRGHQQAETSSMQPCSSVFDGEAGVEPRLETLELPDV
ncbi:hypothetical protein TNCV_2532651 [Trichonephila clavipes]|nr:hypothetical protein TNCV_2532651 [Trichonephila clavipes]